MKAGDKVKLIGVPPDCRDADGLETRTLFEKCLGRTFVIEEIETVDDYPLARLNVGHVLGKPKYMDTIRVEPKYLQIVD